MIRFSRLRAFGFRSAFPLGVAAALLLAPVLTGCDSGSDSSSGFTIDTYTGAAYSGTATATVPGQPTQTNPFTLSVAKVSATALTMTIAVNGVPTPVAGTYSSSGATFAATGTPAYDLRISPSGTFSGSVIFDANTVATASGSISRSNVNLVLSAPAGTITYAGSR